MQIRSVIQTFDLVGAEVLMVHYVLEEACITDDSNINNQESSTVNAGIRELQAVLESLKLDFDVEIGEQPRVHLAVSEHLTSLLRDLIETKMKSLKLIKYVPDQDWEANIEIFAVCRFPNDFLNVRLEHHNQLVMLASVRKRIMGAQGFR